MSYPNPRQHLPPQYSQSQYPHSQYSLPPFPPGPTNSASPPGYQNQGYHSPPQQNSAPMGTNYNPRNATNEHNFNPRKIPMTSSRHGTPISHNPVQTDCTYREDRAYDQQYSPRGQMRQDSGYYSESYPDPTNASPARSKEISSGDGYANISEHKKAKFNRKWYKKEENIPENMRYLHHVEFEGYTTEFTRRENRYEEKGQGFFDERVFIKYRADLEQAPGVVVMKCIPGIHDNVIREYLFGADGKEDQGKEKYNSKTGCTKTAYDRARYHSLMKRMNGASVERTMEVEEYDESGESEEEDRGRSRQRA